MKTLANAQDKAEILHRLSAVGPASQRRWGKMTAREMICHLCDALQVATGEKNAQPVSNWFSVSLMKWVALRTPTHWPHGVSTVPECKAGEGGTPPAEFAQDLDSLRAQLEQFTKKPQEKEFAKHPIFGALTEEEWMRWGYLHMDHHLRQFGA